MVLRKKLVLASSSVFLLLAVSQVSYAADCSTSKRMEFSGKNPIEIKLCPKAELTVVTSFGPPKPYCKYKIEYQIATIKDQYLIVSSVEGAIPSYPEKGSEFKKISLSFNKGSFYLNMTHPDFNNNSFKISALTFEPVSLKINYPSCGSVK